MLRYLALLLLSALAPLSAQTQGLLPAPKVKDAIADRYQPARYLDQRIGGMLGERMKINLEGRLLRVDEKALLGGFLQRPGNHPWIGEHIGKYLDAAVNTWLLTRDPRLKEQMDRMVNRLLPTQLLDGYFGTYTDDQRWTSWDVWSHKYNLIGLMAYYRATGDERVLEACKRMGDLLANTFGEGKRDIIASSTHVGMAATSVLEPVVTLYRYTGEKRYLDFARYIVRSWEQPNGPKLMSSLSTHGNVFKTANGKAYEMMSDLVGLADLYRITGDKTLLVPVVNAWKDIQANRLYLTGTTSAYEHFQDDHSLYGEDGLNVGEGCATVTWLQLTLQLFRLTGEARYAHELERTVYNQLLAAQDPANGNICYFTPLNGTKRPGPGVNCCVSSEPRGISLIPNATWGTVGEGIVLLQYTEGEVHPRLAGGDVRLRVNTDYPRSGNVLITVLPTRPQRFPLLLRVPTWTREFAVKTGGQSYRGKPGEFMRLDRVWSSGDRVEVRIDVTPQVWKGEPSYSGFIALQRGPQVLALDRGKNLSLRYLHLAGSLNEAPTLRESAKYGYPIWEIDGIAVEPGKPEQKLPLVLTPFTETRDQRIWLPVMPKAPKEGVALTAFGKQSHSSYGERVGSICDDRPETFMITSTQRRNPDDWYAVEIERPRLVRRIVFRHGSVLENGGWFDTSQNKPTVQIRRAPGAEWETIGVLSAYPSLNAKDKPALINGQPFVFELSEPAIAVGIRVTGRPARGFSSCAELSAYE